MTGYQANEVFDPFPSEIQERTPCALRNVSAFAPWREAKVASMPASMQVGAETVTEVKVGALNDLELYPDVEAVMVKILYDF